MKSSLEHLPEYKQRQLERITRLYRDTGLVEMLILFGSHARGDWVKDTRTGYQSDYDLLVVVADAIAADDIEVWSRVQDRAREYTHPVLVQAIVHDVVDVNQQIRDGHYFFGDIVREGVMLFETKRYKLSRPTDLTPERRFELAQFNFKYWSKSAENFWLGVDFYGRLREHRHAMFMLHQVAERWFHSVLLVFTAYKPRTHDLFDLSTRVGLLHPELLALLPQTSVGMPISLPRASTTGRYSYASPS